MLRRDLNNEWYHRRRHLAWAATVSSSHNFPVVPVAPMRAETKSSSSALPVTNAGSSWAEKAHEYSQNSSLHGLRYIGDTRLHFLER